jgi:hypothetical protein
MTRKPPLTSRGVEKLSERERTVGLDPEDAAAQWLGEHDPPSAPAASKAARKSKTLHRWRERQGRG